jgi:hypothetical protein
MSVNAFRPRKFEDFEIVDKNQKVVGHIRIKPSGVHWASKGGKVWYGVSLRRFREYMEENGRRKEK